MANTLVGRLRRSGVAAAVALTAALGATAARAESDPTFGLWLIESGRAIVEIGPCAADAAQACGAVVWLQEPNDAAGKPRLDIENPDESLRGRTLCGLDMIGGFDQDRPGKWSGGEIYDPTEGDTYSSKMAITEAGALEVRGFIGISLIGKTQTWTRVSDARGGC